MDVVVLVTVEVGTLRQEQAVETIPAATFWKQEGVGEGAAEVLRPFNLTAVAVG